MSKIYYSDGEKASDKPKNSIGDILSNFTERRRLNAYVAESLNRLEQHKRAEEVKNCGSFMQIVTMIPTGESKIHRANLCQDRLCVVCATEKSRRIYGQVSGVMQEIATRGISNSPVFLTLTVPNCTGEDLPKILSNMFRAFNSLFTNLQRNEFILGWFRSLEITYKEKINMYHPHIHVIILMTPEYFWHENYLTTNVWARMWKKSTGIYKDAVPTDLVTDIRAIYGRTVYDGEQNKVDELGFNVTDGYGNNPKKKKDVVAEVSKYTMKPTDYIKKNDPQLMDDIVYFYSTAVRNRRLYAFGGLMKTIHNELDLQYKEKNKDNKNKIVDDTGKELILGLDYILRTYKWSIGLSGYELFKNNI
jgi:plasmid rolling circle replication initiator protein Rep